jgi:hypothetical protein
MKKIRIGFEGFGELIKPGESIRKIDFSACQAEPFYTRDSCQTGKFKFLILCQISIIFEYEVEATFHKHMMR